MSFLGSFDGPRALSAESRPGAIPPLSLEFTIPQWRIRFEYEKPPLTANQRLHWARKAALTRDVRAAAGMLARQAKIPTLDRCEVWLTWYVTDRRRRDADNVFPTMKAMCDGLVDAGVVEDDEPRFMVKHHPAIQWIPKTQDQAHMVLTVGALSPEAAEVAA